MRPALAPPPAAAWASVHSCSSSDVATGLDHKSLGVRSLYHRTPEQVFGAVVNGHAVYIMDRVVMDETIGLFCLDMGLFFLDMGLLCLDMGPFC